MPALESLPRKIGPYRPIEKIGEGGMGVVYLARDTENRQVAVKVLGPAVAADPDARRRLAREVDTMRRIRSRYVAHVIDADVTSPAPYVVTRYVPGRTLEEAVRDDGPLRGQALQQLAFGLAEALTAIHAAGVIHRDLKPANVMLEDGQPVVIDFGIAHVPDATRLTQTGLVMGTPGYVAPEIIEGRPSTGATDVHSWGTTVAFAASGRQPFGTGDFQTIFYRVLQGEATLKGIPPALLPLVRAALETDPRARPSARWLAARCAEAGRPGVTRADWAPGSGPRPDATRVDRTRGGWQGPPGRAAYRSPAQAAADMADLLPAVDYARDRAASAGGQPGPRAGTSAAAAGRSANPAAPAGVAVSSQEPPAAGHGVVALATVIGAIALSVLLPVAGTVLVLAVITLLRAADRAQAALARRRTRHGAAPGDILVVIVTAPWTVARALLKTALLVPFALIVAVPAAIAAVVLARAATLPVALSWAAGAAVAWYCVGTGSREPRRQLRRISAAVIPTRAAMVVACISSLALALAVVSMAISQPPLIWPATSSTIPHLLPSLNLLPSAGSVLHSVQGWLLRSTVGMLHLP
jgi:predicted Ser/Thr protein kinase